MNKALLVCLFVAITSPVIAADPASMSDNDLKAALKICFDAQTVGGGTLADNPTMAKMCQPIIGEGEKRRKSERDAKKQDSIDRLNAILKK